MTVTSTLIPASIRHRNPGAMGLGRSAKLFGATKSTTLNDAQRNTIATFPTSVDGAGALFHLLWSPTYSGKTLADAIRVWSGGNHVDAYLESIESRTALSRTDVVSRSLIENPLSAIPLGRAMARHEAGTEFPMTDAQWREAHGEFLTVIRGGSILLDRTKPTPLTGPLNLARSHLGQAEVSGSGANPFIVDCFKDVGSSVRSDETSWCAAFTGAMLKRSGCAFLETLTAKDYRNYGHAIDEPEEGAVAVFWRVSPNSWQGHVAFVESWTATTVTVIGGNQYRRETGQSDAVTRMTVPRVGPDSKVICYRRPVAANRRVRDVARDEEVQRTAVGLLSTISAFLYTVWNGVTSAAASVGEWVGVLPDAAYEASNTVSNSRHLMDTLSIPFPVKAVLFVAVASLAVHAYQTWQRRRVHDGRLSEAPYETDEVLPDVTEDQYSDEFGEITPPASAQTPAPQVAVTLEGSRYSREEVREMLAAITAATKTHVVVDPQPSNPVAPQPRRKPKAKRASAKPAKKPAKKSAGRKRGAA